MEITLHILLSNWHEVNFIFFNLSVISNLNTINSFNFFWFEFALRYISSKTLTIPEQKPLKHFCKFLISSKINSLLFISLFSKKYISLFSNFSFFINILKDSSSKNVSNIKQLKSSFSDDKIILQ